MPLPKINTPTYDLTLPSTGKKIKYRPFLVREEKNTDHGIRDRRYGSNYKCCR